VSEAWTPWYKNLAREGDLVGRCSSAPLHDCMKSSASPRFICHTRRRASWLVCCLFDGVDRCITAFLLDEDEFPIRPSAHCAAQDARLIWTCGFEKRMIDTFQHHGADRTQHRFPASTFIDEMRKQESYLPLRCEEKAAYIRVTGPARPRMSEESGKHGLTAVVYGKFAIAPIKQYSRFLIMRCRSILIPANDAVKISNSWLLLTQVR
jgi:hypothetical protein